MHDLAVQVRQLDGVGVDEAERPHARGGEVQRRWRAEAAETDYQYLSDREEDRLVVVVEFGSGKGRRGCMYSGEGEGERGEEGVCVAR